MSHKGGKKKQQLFKIETCSSSDCVDCKAERNAAKNQKKEGTSSVAENEEFRFVFEPLIEYFKKNHTSVAQNNSLFTELLARYMFSKKEEETKKQEIEEEHKQEVDKLREMLSEKFDGNRYVQMMLGAMSGQIEEIKERAEEIEQDKEKLEKEMIKWKKEAAELKRINGSLKNANLQSLAGKANAEKGELAKLKKKLEAREQEVKNLQFTKTDKEKLKSLEMIVLKKDERIETMDKEIDKLEEALDEMRSKLTSVEVCKMNEAGEVKRLNEKIERQRIQISEIQATNIELRTELVKCQQAALNSKSDVPVILNIEKPTGKSNDKKQGKQGAKVDNNRQKIPELMKMDLGEKKLTTANKEPASNCSVCMKKFENKDNHEMCKYCSKGFHSSCVLPWVRNTGICPSCRVLHLQN